MTYQREDRRAARTGHALCVYTTLEGYLEVRCDCGMVVGGKRFEDRTKLTLGDMLELVRLHRRQLDSGKGVPL